MKWKRLYMEEREPVPEMGEEPQVDIDNLVLNIVDDELAEEGAGKAITYGLLAFILGSSGIVEGAEFKRGMLHLV